MDGVQDGIENPINTDDMRFAGSMLGVGAHDEAESAHSPAFVPVDSADLSSLSLSDHGREPPQRMLYGKRSVVR